jgi:Tol biopolymer transport system component
VHHCLEKSADQRFRSAHDVAFALENLASGGESAAPFTAPFARRNRKTSWKWAAIVAGVAGVAAAAGWLARGGPAPEPTFHRLTFQQGTVENARFGPDGKTVLYSARWKGGPPTLYSIPPGSLEPQQLNVGSSTLLAVSPENELAVLLSPLLTYGLYPGKLARVPAAGGGAREIEPNVLAADWNPRSGELAAVSVLRANWQLESPPGKVLRAGPGIDFPRFSKRDGSLAFFENAVGLSWPLLPASGDVVVLDPAGKASVIAAGRHCTGLAWSPAGDEIWFTEWSDGRRTTLYAASLSGKLRTIWSGPGNLALQDVSVDGRALILTRQVQDGVLVLEEGQARERDVSIFDGTVAIDFTPDRRALLVNERGGGGGPGGSVFLTPLDGGLPVKLSKGQAEALSPDGKQVLLTNEGRPGRFTLVPTGSGSPTEFEVEGVRSNQLAKFLPDGRQVVFQGTNGDRPIRLYLAEVGKNQSPRPLTPEGTLVWKGANQVSPDGRSIFFFRDSVDGGTDEVLSLADGSATPILGREPRDIPIRWTEDGRGIYVFKREGLPVRISRLDLATGTKSLVKEFMPADPGGISGMSSVTMTADARLYAFNYRRRISELFLVEGLR